MKLLVLTVAVVLPLPLAAQSGWQLSVFGTAGQEIVQSRIGETRARLKGTMLGGEGVLTGERLKVRLRYAEGRVSGEFARELVEGEALVGFRVTPWLTLWAGPHARAYAADEGDQRWLFWSGRVTARGTLLPGRMSTFVELWKSVTGSVREGSATGQGAEAGLDVLLSGPSLWGRIAYRIERGIGDGARRETVELLALSIAFARP